MKPTQWLKTHFTDKWLYYLAYAILFLSVYSFLNAFYLEKIDPHLFFNADSLTHATFFKDFFIDKFNYKGWVFADSPSFFPEFITYSILHLLTNSIQLSITLNSMLLLISVIIVFDLIFSAIFKPTYLIKSLFVFVLAIFVYLVSKGYFLLLLMLLFSPNWHVGSILISAICLLLCIKSLQKENRYLPFIIVSIVLVTAFSDKLILFDFVIPIILTYAIFYILSVEKNLKIKKLAVFCGLLIAAVLLTFKIYNSVVSFPMKQEIVINDVVISNLTRDLVTLTFLNKINLSMIIAEVEYKFVNDTFLVVWASWVFLGVALFKFIKNLEIKEDHEETTFSLKTDEIFNKEMWFYTIFCIFLTVSKFASTIASGRYAGWVHTRYFTSFFVFPAIGLLFLVLYLGGKKLEKIKNTKTVGKVVFGIYIVVVAFLVAQNGLKFEFFSGIAHYKPENLRCLEGNIEKYNLKSGVAEYWTANEFLLLSQKNLKIRQITMAQNMLRVFAWNNNLSWYFGKDTYSEPFYNFLITKNFDDVIVAKAFGTPKNTFKCNDLTINVYNDAEFDKTVKAIFYRDLIGTSEK